MMRRYPLPLPFYSLRSGKPAAFTFLILSAMILTLNERHDTCPLWGFIS